MTNHAWFHPFAGISGDMALGALLDTGADLATVRSTIAGLGIDGWRIEPERVDRAGISATYAGVRTDDDAHHRPWRVIDDLLAGADLPLRIEQRARAVFARLAEVEGALHGVDPADVHFHEVGSLDAVVDVVGVATALETLGIDTVTSGPVAIGHGTVRAAHGVLPNPAPAVPRLLVGAPVRGVDAAHELTTPTGAALLAGICAGFGPIPAMTITASGYGAGRRDTPGAPNVTQVVLGVTADVTPDEQLVVLEANVDDATGEVLGHLVDQLMAAGARDAWLTPIVMKKGRPAHTISALVDPAHLATLRDLLARESGSIGVRAGAVQRWAAPRHGETVDLDGHHIAIKVTAHRAKAEFADAVAAAAALDRPVREVIAEAEALWRAGHDGH